ncbi:UNVERIFIED_CONTAM: E3 ubiquitin-protein ligase MBR2 [Sesamum latifolium]|uniref:RING-type E3 ubiquitin transferase n=1 Tax=Sesamum latifolium TaxID=2727402 RepID=A0AAW2VUS8_9LAMI
MHSHQPHPATESDDVRRASGGYRPHVFPGEFSFLAPPDGLLLPLPNISALQTETDQTFDTYTYPNWAAAGTPSTTGTDYGRRTRTMYPHDQILDIPTISAQTYRLQVQERNNLEVASNWLQEDEIVILDDIGIEWGEENVKRDGGLSENLILKHLKTRDCCPVNNDGEPEICVVCQDDLCQENSTVGVLDCGHEYHAACIRQWLQQKNICPLCKATALRVDDDDDDDEQSCLVRMM